MKMIVTVLFLVMAGTIAYMSLIIHRNRLEIKAMSTFQDYILKDAYAQHIATQNQLDALYRENKLLKGGE